MTTERERLIRIFAEETAKLLRVALRKTRHGEPPHGDAEFDRVCVEPSVDMVRGMRAHDVDNISALSDDQLREAFQAICAPGLMAHAAKDFVS